MMLYRGTQTCLTLPLIHRRDRAKSAFHNGLVGRLRENARFDARPGWGLATLCCTGRDEGTSSALPRPWLYPYILPKCVARAKPAIS